jgi:hypothetical protein
MATSKLLTVRGFAALVCLWAAMAAHGNPTPARIEVGGVAFESEIVVRGTKLQLNGAAVRSRAFIKIWAGGLYLPRKASTLNDVLSQPGVKRWHVVLMRDVDGKEMGKQFTNTISKDASKSEFVALIPTIARVGEIFSQKKQLNTGESFTLEWLPSQEVNLYFNNKLATVEPFTDKVLFAVLMRKYLGDPPLDASLKAKLLGIPEAAVSPYNN